MMRGPIIFSLTRDDLSKLDGFKEKKISNALNEIRETSTNLELYRWLYSLQIPLTGESVSKLIAKNFSDKFLEDEINFSKEELLAVDGIGEIMAENIVDFFNENKDYIEDYRTKVTLLLPEQVATESKISGKTFVVTGTLSLPRDHFKSVIESQGGKVSSSVSKKTDFLLAGEKAGSKLDKALSLGVTVLSEEDFKSLLD